MLDIILTCGSGVSEKSRSNGDKGLFTGSCGLDRSIKSPLGGATLAGDCPRPGLARSGSGLEDWTGPKIFFGTKPFLAEKKITSYCYWCVLNSNLCKDKQ